MPKFTTSQQARLAACMASLMYGPAHYDFEDTDHVYIQATLSVADWERLLINLTDCALIARLHAEDAS